MRFKQHLECCNASFSHKHIKSQPDFKTSFALNLKILKIELPIPAFSPLFDQFAMRAKSETVNF